MSESRLPVASTSLLATLDGVLRGTFLHKDALAEGRVVVPVRRLVVLSLMLGAIYGVCLGGYAVFRGADQATLQVLASAGKVPLLFLLTLLVTFPSLYVFGALQRLPLDLPGMLRLQLLAIVVNLTVLSSLGPVFAFFAASTNSYPFMLLLNVAFFVIGGVLGFMVLRRATRTMLDRRHVATPAAEGAGQPPPVPAQAAGQTRRVLAVWTFVYGVVGAQMGWLLRPFLGSPHLPFAWFRPREDNVLIAVLRTIGDLFHQ
jgi:hypothetical protein